MKTKILIAAGLMAFSLSAIANAAEAESKPALKLSSPIVTQHCIQGYRFVTFQGIGKLASHQVMNEQGKPTMCGNRLKQSREYSRIRYEALLKTWNIKPMSNPE